MKVKTRITYNAAKLARSLPKMIDNFIKSSGNATANQSRKNIDMETHNSP